MNTKYLEKIKEYIGADAFDLELGKDIYSRIGSVDEESGRMVGSLSDALEIMDPSAPDSKVDAFERQLMKRGLIVDGPNAVTVERFYSTEDSALLFPEYIDRQVRIGMQNYGRIDDIVATRTRIDSDSYKAIRLDLASQADQFKLKRVGEASPFPTATLSLSSSDIHIYKFGLELQSSYESMRRRKVNTLDIHLQQIGAYMADSKFSAAVDVAVNGDGNSNPIDTVNTSTTGVLTYEDLVDFWFSITPYEMNKWLARKDVCTTILTLPEFKDPMAGFTFQKTGELVTPFGVQLVPDFTDTVDANKIIGYDQRNFIEEVYEQDMLTESEKIISRQLEKMVMSEVAGYAKLFNEAGKMLDIAW